MTDQAKEPELDLNLDLDLDDKKPGEGRTIVFDDSGKEIKADPSVKSENSQEAPEETIIKLRQEIEQTKKRESEARAVASKMENERTAETQKVISAIDDAYKSKENSYETAINAAKTELDSIKRQLRDAREKGDIDVEIELEEKLADTRYNFNALNWQKTNLLQEKKVREEAAKARTTANQNGPSYSPKAQAWIDSHPRFNSDDDYQAMVFASHDLATKRGISPDSLAYFEFIENRLNKYMPEDGSPEVIEEKKANVVRPSQPQSLTSTAAPPSRSGSAEKMGSNGRQVVLSAQQLEAADFMGMTPAEYAQDLINQEKEKQTRN